jgi:hypothetical protein
MKFDVYAVLAIGFVCFTVIISLIIVAKTFGRVKLKNSKGEIELGNGKEASDKSSPESVTTTTTTSNTCMDTNCNPMKISYIATTIVNICYKIDYILLHGVMEEQMAWTDQKIKVLQEQDIKFYCSFLKEKIGSKPENIKIKDDSYMSYINVTYRVYGIVKELFRTWYAENHIGDLKESEWEDYKRDKIEYLFVKMNEMLDMTYTTNSIIGKDEIKEEAKSEFTPKLKNEFSEIFDKARKIARQKMETVENLRKELDEFQLQVSGLKK